MHFIPRALYNAECPTPSSAIAPLDQDPQLEAYEARDSNPGGPNVTPKGNCIIDQEQKQ